MPMRLRLLSQLLLLASCASDSDGKCQDNHPYCERWTATGFCSSDNYSVMQRRTHCSKSCKLCLLSVRCSNSHPYCFRWKEGGFCESALYTLDQKQRHCSASCELCSEETVFPTETVDPASSLAPNPFENLSPRTFTQSSFSTESTSISSETSSTLNPQKKPNPLREDLEEAPVSSIYTTKRPSFSRQPTSFAYNTKKRVSTGRPTTPLVNLLASNTSTPASPAGARSKATRSKAIFTTSSKITSSYSTSRQMTSFIDHFAKNNVTSYVKISTRSLNVKQTTFWNESFKRNVTFSFSTLKNRTGRQTTTFFDILQRKTSPPSVVEIPYNNPSSPSIINRNKPSSNRPKPPFLNRWSPKTSPSYSRNTARSRALRTFNAVYANDRTYFPLPPTIMSWRAGKATSTAALSSNKTGISVGGNRSLSSANKVNSISSASSSLGRIVEQENLGHISST